MTKWCNVSPSEFRMYTGDILGIGISGDPALPNPNKMVNLQVENDHHDPHDFINATLTAGYYAFDPT